MSNRWEGNHEYTGPTKLPASETAASSSAALVQNTANPTDSHYEAANHANLSGNATLLTNYNGAAAMRESSNRWVGNPKSTGQEKLPASLTAASSAALAQTTINPNGPTGLVPQIVDQ